VAAVRLPDGTILIASGSHDETVRLGDPVTGAPVGQPLTGHTDAVTAVAAVPMPDGTTLLTTAGVDQSVVAWALDDLARNRGNSACVRLGAR